MSEHQPMIEMHREDDLGDADLDDEPFVYRPSPVAAALGWAVTAPALAIAAIVIATATLLENAAITDIGAVAISIGRGGTELSAVRWEGGIRLGVAVLAVVLALSAAARYVAGQPVVSGIDDDDDVAPSPPVAGRRLNDPAWVRFVIGSALVVGVVSTLLNAAAFVGAMHAQPSNFG